MSIQLHTEVERLLSEIYLDINLSTDNELIDGIKVIIDVCNFTACSVTTLKALHENGPLFDGDIPSKSGLYSLIQYGCASKVIVRNKDGYNACTYKGSLAYKIIKVLNAETSKQIYSYFSDLNESSKDIKINNLINEIRVIKQFYKVVNDKINKDYKIITCEKGHTTLRPQEFIDTCEICVFESLKNN